MRAVLSTFTGSILHASKRMISSVYKFPPIIQANDAIKLFGQPNVKFVDGSWHLNSARSNKNEFIEERIAGAKFFDIEDISDKSSPYPHMLPSSQEFSAKMQSLGISSNDHIIVYAKPEAFSAARVWWMFNVFGHQKVSVLNGGIATWKKAGTMPMLRALCDACHYYAPILI